MNLDIKLVRYDESNPNVEAIKGKYAQKGESRAVFTVLKNLLVINLLPGARYDSLKLPECWDGFVQCSDGTIIQIKDSTLTCSLPSDVNGFGMLVLKAWN